jgi:DNA helicase II / ATP-dependent DNA helicase PcrA
LRLAQSSGEAHHAVEKIALGILHLAALLNPLADISARKRKQRYVRELLADDRKLDKSYLELVSFLITGNGTTILDDWKQRWAPHVRAFAVAIAGTAENSSAATTFLSAEPAAIGSGAQRPPAAQRDNVFRFPSGKPKVQIQVASIHSVKGETHTATLVLDTFFHDHHLAALKRWLVGKKSGAGTEGPRNVSRLKQHYVAMTRPSHLLCLAMQEDCLSNGDVLKLKERGWRVARVTAGGTDWL